MTCHSFKRTQADPLQTVDIDGLIAAVFLLSARRGGASTPRQKGMTNGHVNDVSSPAAGPASHADSPLFSSPAPRRGWLHCDHLYQCC